MTDNERATPTTPGSKVRSTVRLRKLGHCTALPRAAVGDTPGRQTSLPPMDFPVDSPVHSAPPLRPKTNIRRKGHDTVSAPRGSSDSDVEGFGISRLGYSNVSTQLSSYSAVEDWLSSGISVREDALAASSDLHSAGRPSGMEVKEPTPSRQAARGIKTPQLNASSSHGSSGLKLPDQPPTKSNPRTGKARAASKSTLVPDNVPGISARQARKHFDAVKQDMAVAFLKDLDDTITGGKLAELSASTGGVKLNWTNKLNTTAGRANWKRETVRTGLPAQEGNKPRHHASIDIAEKVIDNEHRLLNVIAHEFCHLANFMISGVTGNPHGKEFKAWASKCSEAFSGRGIKVTTKHSYDIDFKYIWSCVACKLEYKRHSRSIDPERHRCGTCSGALQQMKPTPRARGKSSEYQMFVREQMKIVREENPTVPQKDIMRLVAEKWAASPRRSANGKATQVEKTTSAGLRDVTDQLNALELGNGS